MQKGYELNTPLLSVLLDRDQQNQPGFNQLSPTGELLNLSADNLILMALKLSSSQKLIMRCYEANGEAAILKLKSDLNFELDSSINCLETEKPEAETINEIKPHKIVTFKLRESNKIIES